MHTRKRLRKKDWDYSQEASYLVTIVTKDRRRYFGEIENGEVNLSPIGQIAHDKWLENPYHYPTIEWGAFIVMPDHFHAIVHFRPMRFPHRNDMLTLGDVIRGYKMGVTSTARLIDPSFAWHYRYHDRILHTPDAIAAATRYVVNNPKNGS